MRLWFGMFRILAIFCAGNLSGVYGFGRTYVRFFSIAPLRLSNMLVSSSVVVVCFLFFPLFDGVSHVFEGVCGGYSCFIFVFLY